MSCAEIRHLFWQFILMVERSAKAILGWSWWRRRHQARATEAHYRRRARETAELAGQPAPMAPEAVPEEEAAADVLETVWSRLVGVRAPTKRIGRPIEYERRVIFDAIVHVMQTNCGWRQLPRHFPPWQTVYAQYARWRKQGVWRTIWAGLVVPGPAEQLQL